MIEPTPTPPDFRALCAELLKGLDENRHPEVRYPGHLRIVMADARAALEAQPEPERPTKAELRQLFDDQSGYINDEQVMWWADFHKAVRAAFARWGRPAIEPISVSERLPGPKDCDADGQCWWWQSSEMAWFLCDANHRDFPLWTHWLPFHALPIPRSEERNDD